MKVIVYKVVINAYGVFPRTTSGKFGLDPHRLPIYKNDWSSYPGYDESNGIYCKVDKTT